MVSIDREWSLKVVDNSSNSWFAEGDRESIIGAIGITINDRSKRPLFHKLTTAITLISRYFRNLDKHSCNCDCQLDNYKTTHAFVVVGTKEETDNVIEVADADDPGVLAHDYDLAKVVDNAEKKSEGYYSKVALVIPPKELRERIAVIAKECSSDLEIGNQLTEVGELQYAQHNKIAELKKLQGQYRVARIFKRAQRHQLQQQIAHKKTELSELKGRLQEKEQAAATLDRSNIAKYNNKGLAVVGLAGKLPVISTRPITHKTHRFAKNRVYNKAIRDYLQVLEGRPLTTKNTPKAMICSEFAVKMLKMAHIDLLLDIELSEGELRVLKTTCAI